MNITTLITTLFILNSLNASNNFINFEDNIQQFVIETKQLEIPGYPYAFNPSILRWKDKLLLSFRIIPGQKKSFNSEIGLVFIDENFQVVSTPQILKINPLKADPNVPSRAEDARLVQVGDQIYIIYADNRNEKITAGGFRQYVAKLEIEGSNFTVKEAEALVNFEGSKPTLREKNWVAFDYQGDLLLAYSLDPHIIFRPLLDGNCELFAKTSSIFKWDYGVLRGGTPALKIDSNRYLSFFHSSKMMKSFHSDGTEVLHYFMGAYTFSTSPPFELLEISPEPIVGENFYNGKTYTPFWQPVRVVYPAGYLIEESYFTVFFGRQDHEIWIVKIDRKGLLQSLLPVKNND